MKSISAGWSILWFGLSLWGYILILSGCEQPYYVERVPVSASESTMAIEDPPVVVSVTRETIQESFVPTSQTVTTIQTAMPIDVLWVIDNSGSMEDEQAKIAAGFDAFARKYITDTRDVRMSVIATDYYLTHNPLAPPSNTPLTSPALFTSLVPAGILAGDWINQTIAGFQQAARVGISGSGDERSLESISAYLTEQASKGCQTDPQAKNECFFRRNSARLFVIVSDEIDGSRFNLASQWQANAASVENAVAFGKGVIDNYLLALDGKAANPFYFVSAIASPVTALPIDCRSITCHTSFSYVKLVDAIKADSTNKAGGFSSVMDIMAADYTAILDSIGTSIERTTLTNTIVSEFQLRMPPFDRNAVKVELLFKDGSVKALDRSSFEVNEKTLRISEDALILLELAEKLIVTYT